MGMHVNQTAADRSTTSRLNVCFNKVPEITLGFWIIKIMCTTVGETAADFLAVDAELGLVISGAIVGTLLALSLFVQLQTRRYTPWIYWLTVVLISIVGTQVTDLLTDVMDVSLYISTAVFSVMLAMVFLIWFRVEHNLSIHEIFPWRRELFYWSAILCTFALGTAAGDLATEAIGLGFKWGVGLFGGLIFFTYLTWRFGANAVLIFWIAYILTRPFGASLGDLLTQAKIYGGLGVDSFWTSVLFLCVIVLMVIDAQFSFVGDESRKSPTKNLKPNRQS